MAARPASAAIVGSVLVGLMVLAPSVARAICGAPPPISVAPRRGIAVPRNARVAMTAPATWRASQPSALVLTTAPRIGQPRARVATRERAWTGGGVERIELALAPGASLAPSTAYELQTQAGVILGAFTTGTTTDTTAPSWAGLTAGHIAKAQRGGGVTISPECGDDLFTLEARGPAADDQTPVSDVRYALWAGAAQSPLDYTAPPLTWQREAQRLPTRAGDTRFILAFGSTDGRFMDFDLPSARPLKIGVKAIDLAGNETAATELTLTDR